MSIFSFLFKTTPTIEKTGITYPERVILANLSHGSIIVDKRGNPKTFVMPQEISMKRGFASVPGICNFISSSNNTRLVAEINRNKRDLERIPFESVDEIIRPLLNKFKQNDKEELLVSVTSDVNNMRKGKEEFDKDYERYHHGYDKFWNLSTYKPGDTVINKKFQRTNSETTRREWRCLFLNSGGAEIDLLTIMRQQLRGEADTIVYLQDIVEYLKQNGVKEIIMFDLSCSPFLDENNADFTDDERIVRLMRNNIMNSSKPGKFGGKKRKSYKKYKYNKHKKTRRTYN
jgi:hypothetical protein